MRYDFTDEHNLYGYGETDDFSFPAKVKQIGAIDTQMKIYMEDYVYTYLYQYGKSGGNTEKMAALVGRQMTIDGQDVVLISGAIQGRGLVQENGTLTFGAQTWEYIGSQLEMYFQGLTLVGWAHAQPGFGAFLVAKDEAFHKAHFKEPWQVLFTLDTVDKLDAFYVYSKEQTGLRQAMGYFVYYEKNQEMQEYMLDHSMVRPREAQKETEQETNAATAQKVGGNKSEKNEKGELPRRNRRPTPEERMDAAKEIRQVLQRRAKQAKTAQKNRYAMLTGVSCVLCVVCVCMGFALIRNVNRLQILEQNMAQVQNSYTALAAQMEDVQVQSAFAVSQSTQPAKTQEETTVQEESTQNDQTNTEEKIHIVLEGETLGSISRKYYGTMDGIYKIMEANGLQDPNLIVCGQKLRIPE